MNCSYISNELKETNFYRFYNKSLKKYRKIMQNIFVVKGEWLPNALYFKNKLPN